MGLILVEVVLETVAYLGLCLGGLEPGTCKSGDWRLKSWNGVFFEFNVGDCGILRA